MGSFSTDRSPSQRASTEHSANADWRLDKLINRLPPRLGATVRLIRQPSHRWQRTLAGTLLIFGGILGFLPILGLWMLPLGFALLAEDVQLLRSWRSRLLDWVERRHPQWLDSAAIPPDPP